MRQSFRRLVTDRNARARMLAVAAAASGFAWTNHVSAQTWTAAVSGNWNTAANWLGGAPASGAATQVGFNASGATSYTATQNIATPFVLNVMNFNNSGTGLVTVAGNAISFAGATNALNQNSTGNALVQNALTLSGASNTSGLTFGGTGSGTVTLSGALTSSPAASGTTGASVIDTNPNGRLVISGGGTLYGLRADRGNMFVQGGTWNLTSSQRGNDAFGGVNDNGFWGVVAGNSGAGPGNITVGGGAKLNAVGGFAAFNPGQTGLLTFTDPGSVATFSQAGGIGRFGTNWGTGGVQILNGAVVNTTRTDIARQAGGAGTILVSGTGSRLNSVTFDLGPDTSTGVGTVSAGGQVVLTDGALSVGWGTDLIGDPILAHGTLTVTGSGSSFVVGTGGTAGSGQLAAAIGLPGVPSTARINVLAGAHLDAENSFLGESDGSATMTVDGTGSNFVNRGQFLMESAPVSSMTVSNGGLWTNQFSTFTSSNAGDRVQINVTGANSVADLGANVADTFAVFSGGGGAGFPGGTTTITINSGGEMRANLIAAASNPDSRTDITVDGPGSKLTIAGPDSQLIVADDNGAVSNVTVSNGGQVSIGANGAAFLSTGTTAISTFTVTGASSSLVSAGAGVQLQVGGSGSLNLGTATFNVLNNATANVSDLVFVFDRGTVNVGAGTTPARLTTGDMAVSGRVNYNAGTLTASGTLEVAGTVALSSAARLPDNTPTNKKTLEVGVATLTSSGVIDLNDNDMLIHDNTAGARQKYEGFIAAARNGGAWNQPGITSTAAKTNASGSTTLAIVDGSDYTSINGPTFNGRPVAAGDKVIKYTWYGDADLNGEVNFDDYVLIDNGFNGGLTGWFNGDFDLSGAVDFDDYVLIDLGFNSQTGTMGRVADLLAAGPDPNRVIVHGESLTAAEKMAVGHAVKFGSGYVNGFLRGAVPEPAVSGLLSVATLAALRRRRRAGR